MGQEGGESNQPGRWRTFGRWVHRGLLALVTFLALLVMGACLASYQTRIPFSYPAWTGWQYITLSSGDLYFLDSQEFPYFSYGVRRPMECVVVRQWRNYLGQFEAYEWRIKRDGTVLSHTRKMQIKLLPPAIVLCIWPAIWLTLRFFRRRKRIARGFEVVRP